MKKTYFSFGSDEKFPYQNTYLIVVSNDLESAFNAFREKYPDIHPDCLNCAFYYTEDQWKKACPNNNCGDPAEVIFADDCYGKKPEGFDDLFLYVPEKKQLIMISEGTGENLLKEDLKEGYVDYLYYEQYALESGLPEEDGGMYLLKQLVQEKYRCRADCIPEIMEEAYDDIFAECRIL